MFCMVKQWDRLQGDWSKRDRVTRRVKDFLSQNLSDSSFTCPPTWPPQSQPSGTQSGNLTVQLKTRRWKSNGQKSPALSQSFPHPCGSSPVIKTITMEGKNDELKRKWHRSSDWNRYTLSHLVMRFPNTKTQGRCAEHSLVRRHCTKA